MLKVNFKWQSTKNTNFLVMILFLLFNIEVFAKAFNLMTLSSMVAPLRGLPLPFKVPDWVKKYC